MIDQNSDSPKRLENDNSSQHMKRREWK